MSKLIIKIIFIALFLSQCAGNATDCNIPFDHYFHTEPILPYSTWGSMRGLHYFGLRTASPDSPAVGLIWFANNGSQDIPSLQMRHWCDGDDNATYSWKSHDFYTFGDQLITDTDYTLRTSFIKFTEKEWTAQVAGDTSGHTGPQDSLSVIIYVEIERDSDFLSVLSFNTSGIHINGYNKFIGNFTLNIGPNNSEYLFAGRLVSQSSIVDVIHTLKSNLYPLLVNGTQIYGLKTGQMPAKTTLIAYQLVINSRTDIYIEFNTGNGSEGVAKPDDYNKALAKRITDFDLEFEQKFSLKAKGFNESQREFAKIVLREMLGSIGYFNGNLSVDSPGMDDPVSYGPLAMPAAIPSREHYPRPFLWDDGFHNLIIQYWNSSLTMLILKSWLNIMNVEGWIPREITIGKEGLAKFGSLNTQRDTYGNPPALLITLDSLLNRNQTDVNYI